MNQAIIDWSEIAAYAAVGLPTARFFYVKTREREIEKAVREFRAKGGKLNPQHLDELVAYEAEHGDAAPAAFISGIVWPIAWCWYLVFRKPALTPVEKAMQQVRLEQETEELRRTLDAEIAKGRKKL